MDKVALSALRQVFPEYFSFPCLSSFHQILHKHYHRYRYNRTYGCRHAEGT
ncbi:hypothetical protein B7P43_G18143 [Cryptotermes secundus]|uniref:Uncharacterized protein n=1 Tax=Cryptotermes secundus TaxID=105785 RepID=A0A2J7PB82_9NEOP|nr:hypothetical protein B7P43_G18143 [Cryptotermes secundus]